jgi:uncharacterized protein YjbI with pentapeptide repeats
MPANRSGKYVSSLAIGPQVAKVIEDIRVSSAAKALGVELGPLVRERPLSRTWCVRSPAPDGKELAMVSWTEGATTAERELFSKMAEAIHAAGDGLPGVLRVSAIAPSRDAFLTDLWTAGSVRDLSVLRWPPRRRVEFVLRTVRTVEGLHMLGIVHGCLCTGNVLLDDALQPIVAEAGSVPVHAAAERFGNDAQIYVAFAAPEVVKGEAATVRSDVYSLGRILEDTLKGDPPNAELEAIVRRCTAGLPSARYSEAGELASALEAVVGLLPAEEPAPRTITSIPAPRTSTSTPAPRGSTSIPAPVRPSSRVRKEEPPAPTRARVSTRPAAWHPPRALGIVGLLAATSAVVASALVGGSNADFRRALAIALVAGVALATTLVRPPGNAGRGLSVAVQLLLALACATLLVVLDPLAFTYRLAARRHLRGDAASRRTGIQEIMRLGRDFRGLFLADADLSGLDMERSDLRGANLSRANLTRTRLAGADVSDASLDEAAFAGADLRQVDLTPASVRGATCDAETRLPNGWFCSEGRLRRTDL